MIAKLRELAERAKLDEYGRDVNGGVWEYVPCAKDRSHAFIRTERGPCIASFGAYRPTDAQGELIAACSPANILRLIAVAEAAEKWRDADAELDAACDEAAHSGQPVPSKLRRALYATTEPLRQAIDALRKGDGA